MHIDIGVTENCKNPDSYGMICVWCNECGRFDNEPLPTEEDNLKKEKRDAESEDKREC